MPMLQRAFALQLVPLATVPDAIEQSSCVPGLPVVILEDVITTGGSTLKAVEKLRAVGAEVVGVVALVDRLEGGAEAIRAAGLPVVSICTRRDFIADSP